MSISAAGNSCVTVFKGHFRSGHSKNTERYHPRYSVQAGGIFSLALRKCEETNSGKFTTLHTPQVSW